MLVRHAVVAVICAGLVGCTSPRSASSVREDPARPSADAPASSSSKSQPRKPADQRRVYRLDFVVASIDLGKPPSTSTHTLNLEESTTGELRVGANVPLSPGGGARQDVGLLIRCTFTPVGDDLLLENNVEMSTADDAPTIRKISMRGDAVVSPGKPTLVASAEDPTSHKRFEVTVTATKLRLAPRSLRPGDVQVDDRDRIGR